MSDSPTVPAPAASANSAMARLRSDLPLAILCLLMLVLPLYRSGSLEDSFITPKVLLLQFCVLLALLGSLFQWRQEASRSGGAGWLTPPSVNWTAWSFAGLVAVHLLSILYARSPALGLHASIYWVSAFLLFCTFRLAVRGTTAVNLLFDSGAVAAVIAAAWTIAEDATRGRAFGEMVARLPDWRGHLAAGLGNSGHVAGFMGLFLPWVIYRLFRAETLALRLLLLVALTLLACGFVITWSVGSSGATILALLIWIPIAWRARVFPLAAWRSALLLVVPLVVACGVYLLPHPLNPHTPSLLKEAFGSERWAEGWPTRVVIWKTTLHMIGESFPIGIGAGNFTLEYVRQVVPGVISDPTLRVYAGAFTNDAHNEYLHVLCETGLAGIALLMAVCIAFFWSIASVLRQVSDADSRWLLICAGAGVTVFLLDALMTFPLRLPAHFAALCFFLAVPRMLAANEGANARSGGYLAKYLLALLLLLCCIVLQFRRVMAEYHLKQGRSIIESAPIMMSGGIAPAWALAESQSRAALMHLAQGQKQQMHAALTQAKNALNGPAAEEAERHFRTALKWDPRYSNASSRLGALILMQGNYAGAAQITGNTLRDLESSEIHERLGFAAYLQQNWSAARTAWQTCKLRRPVQAPLYEALLQQIPKQ